MGRIWRKAVLSSFMVLSWHHWDKTRETSLWIVRVPAEIRTWHFQNTSYRCADLLGITFLSYTIRAYVDFFRYSESDHSLFSSPYVFFSFFVPSFLFWRDSRKSRKTSVCTGSRKASHGRYHCANLLFHFLLSFSRMPYGDIHKS